MLPQVDGELFRDCEGRGIRDEGCAPEEPHEAGEEDGWHAHDHPECWLLLVPPAHRETATGPVSASVGEIMLAFPQAWNALAFMQCEAVTHV